MNEKFKLKDLFVITRGKVLPQNKIHETGKYPVYSSQTKNNGLLGYYDEFLYENAITWTTDGANAGDVNYREGKFYCTNVCGVLLKKKIKPTRYIALALSKITKNYVSYVGNPKLMNNVMEEIEIEIPPLEEQEKIGCFFKEIDELIQLKKDEIFNLKVILTNYIDKFVMNNILNNPKTTLGSEISSISGTSLEKYTSDDAQMKFISIGNYDPQGSYVDDDKRCILNDKTSKYVLSKDDLVMVLNDKTKDGKIIGSTILIDEDNSYIFNQRSEKIICSENINSNFLWWIINSKSMRRKIFNLSQGGTQIYINFKDIKQIKINIPPITEQIEIVNSLNDINEIINLKSKELYLLERKKRYYLNKIFC